MSKQQIIYIEDQDDTRDTFVRSLKRIYGPEFEIVAPVPCSDIMDMRKQLFNYENPVAFVLDEKLQFTGETKYLGSNLAEKIREIDSKVPVYILTSFAGDVDPLSGSVEFVIDKNITSDPEQRNKLAQRMRRHLNTYQDIKTERCKRFDELLAKSINNSLSDDEIKEYEELNFIRVKPVLIDETVPSEQLESEMEKQNELLKTIQEDLDKLKG